MGSIIVLMILVALSILYTLSYFAGGGPGITALCNSYLVSEGKTPSKLDQRLAEVWCLGYSNRKHQEKVTKPFVKTLVNHFMNNVNAFGPVSGVEMKFDLKFESERLEDLKDQIVSGSSAKSFLESLMGFEVPVPAGYGQYHWEQLPKLIALLGTLGGGGMMGMMQQMQEPGKEPKKDPWQAEKEKFGILEIFEKYKKLNELIDPDFYFGMARDPQYSGLIQQYFGGLFVGTGPSMSLSTDAAEIIQRLTAPPQAQKDKKDPLANGGLLTRLLGVYNAQKSNRKVSPLSWIVPKSVTLEVTRGVFSSETVKIWEGGPMQHDEPRSNAE